MAQNEKLLFAFYLKARFLFQKALAGHKNIIVMAHERDHRLARTVETPEVEPSK